MKSHFTVKLLTGTIIALLIFLLFSLPNLARGSDDPITPSPESSTPTSPSSSPTPTEDLLLTPSPTVIISPTVTITTTQEITPTFTSTPTYTVTATPQPGEASAVGTDQLFYLPNISNSHFVPPSPPEQVLFCDNLGSPLNIPDNNTNGVNNTIPIGDNRMLVSIRLYLDISHTWVGDLVVKLSHPDSGQSITVLNRPGPAPLYCRENDVVSIFDDAAAQPADEQCATSPHAISGIYIPTESMSQFSGVSVAGTWTLNISDWYVNDTGALNHWCLQATLVDSLPPPTPTPPPMNLPSSAAVSGMWGQDQQLQLDCESRSAVDWARHFGFNIDEIDFLNHLPTSDDPEVGFVGYPDGTWGKIPPDDYGVHAPPVASLLRNYGLTAQAYRSLHWDDLRAEIAAGNPAIVWIIGGYNYNLVNGTPHIYTANSTGATTIVAPGEHTVILIGYSPTDVTILNGAHIVSVPLDQFLDSWSALDFMAVIARP